VPARRGEVKEQAMAAKKSTKKKPAAKKPAAKAKKARAKAPAAAAKVKPPAAKAKTPATTAKTPATTAAKPATAKPAGGKGDGTRARPWQLTTPPGSSAFEAFRDETADPPALIVRVGKTELRYHLAAIDDLLDMLKAHGDWLPLGGADEQKPASSGTVEAWGRDAGNPVGGWYGLKKGLRGRFAVYLPPVLEQLGTAEVEHNAKNNRMRAK
jgi:hypothetical protein